MAKTKLPYSFKCGTWIHLTIDPEAEVMINRWFYERLQSGDSLEKIHEDFKKRFTRKQPANKN